MLTASDSDAGDWFGSSISIDGDTVVVGAHRDDDADPGNPDANSGSAYVFERDEGGADNWGEVKKLTASDGAEKDIFGFSVAISGASVIAGAYRDDDSGDKSGSAYVFDRDEGGADNWGEVKKLTAGDAAAEDEFGHSVAISGKAAVIGARNNDDAGDKSGSAYVFGVNQSLDQFACLEAKKLYTPRRYKYKKFGGITHLSLSHSRKQPDSFCSSVDLGPVDEEGQRVSNPDAHLTCYEKKHWKYSKHFWRWWKHKRYNGYGKYRRRSEYQEVNISNMFGKQTLRVATKKPNAICLPSGKGEDSIIPVDLDRFKCFESKKKRGTEFVKTEVTIGEQTWKVKKPVSICGPVDENGVAIEDATDYLACYKIKMKRSHGSKYSRYSRWRHWKPRFSSEKITVNNDFGEGQKLKVSKLETICVPTTVVPPIE